MLSETTYTEEVLIGFSNRMAAGTVIPPVVVVCVGGCSIYLLS